MSGVATTSVLFTSHELELLIEAITNLAIEMEPTNSEEAIIRDELAAMEYDLREALERVGVEPTPVTAEWVQDEDDTVAWASTEDHFIDLGMQAREQVKQLGIDNARREERRQKAIRAQHDDIIHNIFGEFQVAN
jgi:hypothetical protein